MGLSSRTVLALVVGMVLVAGAAVVAVGTYVGVGTGPSEAATDVTPSTPAPQETTADREAEQTTRDREGTDTDRTTTTPDRTTTTTASDGPETVTYSVAHASELNRNYTETVREAFDFWASKPRRGNVTYRFVPDSLGSDVHLRFIGSIERCNGAATETRFYYCTPSDLPSGQSSARLSSVYEEAFMRNLVRYVVGKQVGYDDPEAYEGVSEPSEMETRYRDPWPLQSEVVVNLSVEAGGDRNWSGLVSAGIDYWNRNDHRYGTYTENLTFDPDAERADVTVRIRDRIPACGIHDSPDGNTYLGCADFMNRSSLAAGNETVDIVAGYTDETTLRTVKHEFGHLFGVEHGQPPMPIMNESDPGATRIPKPNATERAHPFGNGSIDVYVDYDSFSAARVRLEEEIQRAVDYYDRGADGHVNESLDVRLTDDRASAEIVVREGPLPCADATDDGSCSHWYGNDTDSDPAYEVFTTQNITLRGIDTDAVSWHVGAWMGYTVAGAENRSELPEPFRDAEYDERRGAWYR